MTPKRTLTLSLGLVVLVNLFVLGGVAYNRSNREAVLNLTERELTLVSAEKDDTSISLSMDVNLLDDLSQQKLKDLGYNLKHKYKEDWYSFPSKKVFVALEYDGPAWQKWVADKDKQIAKAEKKLKAAIKRGAKEQEQKDALEDLDSEKDERGSQSHWFPVDVALDRVALVKAHPATETYVIVPAQLQVNYQAQGDPLYRCSIRLLLDQVHVDQRFRRFFEGKSPTDKRTSRRTWVWDSKLKRAVPKDPSKKWVEWRPSYQVTLAFGNKMEPWIVNCGLPKYLSSENENGVRPKQNITKVLLKHDK